MASLITSGSLTGWSSTLEDSEHGDLIHLNNDLADPGDGIIFTELDLHELFEDGKPLEHRLPGSPLYQVSNRSLAVAVDDDQIMDWKVSPHPPPDEPLIMSRIPERPYFFGQNTAAERITFPNGKMATRVVMKNYLTNGDVEEKFIVQEPGKSAARGGKGPCFNPRSRVWVDSPINLRNTPRLDFGKADDSW